MFRGVSIFHRKIRLQNRAANRAPREIALAAATVAAVELDEAPAVLAEAPAVLPAVLKALAEAAVGAVEQVVVKY